MMSRVIQISNNFQIVQSRLTQCFFLKIELHHNCHAIIIIILSQMNTTCNYANCYSIAVGSVCTLACFCESNSDRIFVLNNTLTFHHRSPLHQPCSITNSY